ncbi:hypothetical protein ABFX02_06G135900 [Erythranthe guttata]
MSTVHKSHGFDLESANDDTSDTLRNGGGGGDGCCTQVAAAGPPSSDANEIVRVPESKDMDKKRDSNVSECSVEMMDLECGTHDEKKVHLNLKRDCRICHLSMDATNQESGSGSGTPIELGCSCKNDLAAAHSQCAESWFKIKGNKTCEICGSIAQNVTGVNEAEMIEQWNEETIDAAITTARLSESRNFWKGHRFLNFLLACMVFAFVISWLFHFNVPS